MLDIQICEHCKGDLLEKGIYPYMLYESICSMYCLTGSCFEKDSEILRYLEYKGYILTYDVSPFEPKDVVHARPIGVENRFNGFYYFVCAKGGFHVL